MDIEGGRFRPQEDEASTDNMGNVELSKEDGERLKKAGEVIRAMRDSYIALMGLEEMKQILRVMEDSVGNMEEEASNLGAESLRLNEQYQAEFGRGVGNEDYVTLTGKSVEDFLRSAGEHAQQQVRKQLTASLRSE